MGVGDVFHSLEFSQTQTIRRIDLIIPIDSNRSGAHVLWVCGWRPRASRAGSPSIPYMFVPFFYIFNRRQAVQRAGLSYFFLSQNRMIELEGKS